MNLKRAIFALLLAAVGMATWSILQLPPPVTSDPLPKSFTKLEGGIRDGRVFVTGKYRGENGKLIFFETTRGPRINVLERLAGANTHEVDMCFTDAFLRPLLHQSGGHGGTPCGRKLAWQEEALAPDPERVADVMDALAKMKFNDYYKPEYRALTEPRHFLRTGAIPAPPSPEDASREGAVIINR